MNRPRPIVKGIDDAGHCDWQECEADAVYVRETKWGDMHVCERHSAEPLEDSE